jgi:ATP synthase protein I
MALPDSPWKALSLVSLIGADLAICTVGGVWLGRKADLYFGTPPWFMIIGLLLGIVIGVLTIIPIVKKHLGE